MTKVLFFYPFCICVSDFGSKYTQDYTEDIDCFETYDIVIVYPA